MEPQYHTGVPSIKPDSEDGWSPEQQLALMLDLFAAQMDAALQEADHTVERLTDAFTALITPPAPGNATPAQGEAAVLASAVHPAAAQAVVAMQFYDRLSQRLGHVRYSLSTLAMFMCDPQSNRQRERWQRLQNSLRRLYSSEEERALFEMMMQGTSAQDALERTADRRELPQNNVELF
jgi:hypothetical protein